MGGYSNWGIRATLERAQRFTGQAFAAYLRVSTQEVQVAQQEEFASFGFLASASGQTELVEDVLIDPPPLVQEIPLRDIGLNAAQLSFGARKFTINHTWVRQRQQQTGYVEAATGLPDWYRVFRDKSVLGLYYNSRLGKIVSIIHVDIGMPPNQAPYMWHLVVNFPELPAQG